MDTLAKRAAEGKATTDLRDFISFQMTERFLRSAAWFWFLFPTDLHCFWSEKSLKLPAKPSTSPAVDLLDCTEGLEKDSHTAVGNLNIKIATANVLSLKAGSKQAESDAWGPARQELLLKQFHDHQYVCHAGNPN